VFGGLKDLVALSPAEVEAQHGAGALALQAWLTAHPEALQSSAPAPLDFARAKLDESAQLYVRGEREAARQAAIAAYLEGFELVEANPDAVDAPLRVDVEREMMALRSMIGGAVDGGQGADAVKAQVVRLHALLERAQEKLSGDGLAPATAFFSSLLILLREGLEAILVLAAIIAYLIKAGRRDALPYVHAGWGAAVVLGAVTWVLATYVIGLSGADREITEGVTALLAAAMLIYVGFWLHSKAYAHAWRQFIREQTDAALGKKTLWAMAAVSFLAVYRELFEIVLFYQALWAQAGEAGSGALLGGIGVAAVTLAVIGWAIFKYSIRLPIGPFFAVMSILLAILAVVFAGHGIAALQEAGIVGVDPIAFVNLPALGIRPTLQTVVAQAVTLAIVAASFYLASRGKRAAETQRTGGA
jgi:high-affinity iron transporter